MLQTHSKDRNSIIWELTTKFQKGSSEIDYISASLINDNDLDTRDRATDLFLISSQDKVFYIIYYFIYFMRLIHLLLILLFFRISMLICHPIVIIIWMIY